VSPDLHTVEGIARVVSIDGGVAWFEPEQTTSCGHCASSAACGVVSSASVGAVGGGSGIGSIARRIEFRRFALDNANDLHVGDRVVVGVNDRSLIKASLTAYAIPLVTALSAGGIAQGIYGSDFITMIAMAAGLVAGLAMSAVAARLLGRRGELSPRFLRRAAPGETCHTG
jgi:sigma-E factor negative regulatory protein RseC